MTEKMVSDLKLDEKQVKKVTKLNKKFKTLIEGEQQENMKDQRPPMGQGRPDGNRGGGRPGGGFGGGMPGGGMGGPGGFGGAPGSRQKDIKYTGATTLTATATETGKTYESSKADESASMATSPMPQATPYRLRLAR